MASDKEKKIEHLGRIHQVSGDTIKVNLINVAACSSCHVKGACSVSDVDNKVIEVANTGAAFKPGDSVKVAFNESQGVKALFLGYIIPFIVLMVVLIIAWYLTGNELATALLALGSLIPYYMGLTLFRKKLENTFTFKISRS
jgi:sigma-E factor negative regulatory protein RseC